MAIIKNIFISTVVLLMLALVVVLFSIVLTETIKFAIMYNVEITHLGYFFSTLFSGCLLAIPHATR